jgi:GT2 family glycosyltransferase
VKDGPWALFITVNFRHVVCTLQFLNNASELEGFKKCHLLIVDNNSEDGSVGSIRRAIVKFGNVELLESPKNRGYFGAANWALRHYLASHGAPDWVIVCNNDIVFNDREFLSRLFRTDPGAAGVVAPTIISGLTGHDANPSIRHRPREFRMMRYRLWLSNYYAMWLKQWLSPFVRRARYKFSRPALPPGKGLSRTIYAPHGSFLIFSRKFFEAGGFIDDGFFLYAEEFSVAEMCRHLGLPVIHDPELRVWHEESQSTGRMLSRNVYLHQREGFSYARARYESSYPELGTAALPARTESCDPTPESRPIPDAGDRVR